MAKIKEFDSKQVLGAGETTEGADVVILQSMLVRFGYLRPGSYEEGVFDKKTEKAVRKYQRLTGLTVDGVAGDETKGQIVKPRCIQHDSPGGSAVGAFTVASSYPNNHLTYAFENDPEDLPASDAKTSIRAQFAKWEAICSLTFSEVTTTENPTIKIAWKKADHGDGSPFDGPGSVLAHAFYPPPRGGNHAGEMHFDEAESFSLDGAGNTYKLGAVALHEIGHLIGLEHSSDQAAIMAPYYDSSKTTLQADDIAGARTLYPNALTHSAQATGTLSETNTSDSYNVDVAEGGMRIILDGDESVDFDIYAKFGSNPTPNDWEYRSWSTGDENLVITSNPAGKIYILVDRYEGNGGYTLRVEYNQP